MNILKYLLLVFIFTTVYVANVYSQDSTDKKPNEVIRGINLAGAEFAGNKLPGINNKDYVFPNEKDIKIFADFGFQLIRLPFKWERLQPVLEKDFDKQYLANIKKVVIEANKYEVKVVLDVHNYGTYKGDKIGTDIVTQQAFNHLWFHLAKQFKNNDNVLFGIMNEPNKHSALEWFPIAQGALASIRKAGAKQKVLIPSTYWSNAHRFNKKDGLYSNADLLQNIQDPENNFVFEVHTYFDKDNSGRHATCPKEDIGIKRLREITSWLQDNNFQAFLGEFGASKNEDCLKIMTDTLAFIDENSNAWYGWSYWGASRWFGDYIYNVYPPEVEMFPQAAILKSYIENNK